jgi:predicted ATPase/class 3 adenylate cyclase
MPTPPPLPTGTVTFLFTDVESSTRLLEQHPSTYRAALRRHHDLLREAVEAHGGVVFETVGDAVYAAFAQAGEAVAAALAGQLALAAEPWPGGIAPRVRMGLHTGGVELQGTHYFGVPLYRCARLMGTAHGGQVVLSLATAELVRDGLPAGATLHDLGEQRLRDLQRPERVFQLTHADLPAEFPPLRSLDALPNNLPLQLTSFVGRERELAAVADLLARHRLVTLTGPGGSGKTRLALHVAADLLPGYPDGVWLAELAPLVAAEQVPQAVAQAVGVREEPGRPLPATLAEALRPKRLLLVLDNCEHLLDPCARLADALLRTCPHLTILATSREALGIAGETAWRVPSLVLPDAAHPPPVTALTQYEAVRLFVDRAVAAQPAFRVTDANAPAVAQVCARLDGIPLAIELAAARVRVLPVEQLLGRLEDRFRLLTGGSRTALERHQTLQAAVDWSHDLLTAPEQALFAQLAVFAGGWTLEAAEAVCVGEGIEAWEVLDLLTRLADKSLAAADEQPGGTARYRLLETLRQYAQQKLAARGGAAAVRRRHAAHYLALAEGEVRTLGPLGSGPGLRGAAKEAWLARLDADHDNLRAALRWLVEEGNAAAALPAVKALTWDWWVACGFLGEARAWLEAVLALPSAAPGTAARAWLLRSAAIIAGRQRDVAWMRTLGAESLAIFRALNDRYGMTQALRQLRHAAFEAGDLAAVDAICADELAVLRELEASDGVVLPAIRANVLRTQGDAARQHGHLAAAQRLYEESLALYRQAGGGSGFQPPRLLHRLGLLAVERGAPATARALLRESLEALVRLGYRGLVPGLLEAFAALAAAEGQHPRTLSLAGAADALREAVGERPLLAEQVDLKAPLAAARQALGESAAAAAWAAGRAMSPEQAVAYALGDAAEGRAPD